MKKGDFRFKRGFTIIEVSLVLAIAGLIFLMVFVALPSLQRNQRDARRREDVMTYLEELKAYQRNNRGYLPNNTTAWNSFFSEYFKNFVDPSGGEYQQVVVQCGDVNADATCNNNVINNVYSSPFPFQYGGKSFVLLVVERAACDGDKPIKTSNPRNVAVLYKMEGAGVYCNNI